MSINANIIDSFKTSQLHYAELILIANFEGYIKNLEAEISNLKSNLEILQQEHIEAEKDIVSHLSNPINSYLLTKRLTTDWKHVEKLIEYDSGIEYIQNITKQSINGHFPNEKDLKNAILNLVELQQQYNLTVEEITSGNIDGINFGKTFSAVDCFEIGRILLLESNFVLGKKWFEESLKRYDDKNVMIRKENILDFLSWCNLQLGNFKDALEQSKESFVLNPSMDHVYKNIKFIESKLNDQNNNLLISNSKWSTVTDVYSPINTNFHYYMTIFDKACSGKLKKHSEYEKVLICTYLTDNHPFLKLAPFKIEEINYDPIIIIAYDIISNKEIEMLKDFTNFQKNLNNDSSKKLQKFTISEDTNSSLLTILDQRIADISFLNKKSGEKLQISTDNSGILARPYFDILSPNLDSTGLFFDYNKGNRIATALIFLNDDFKGGETVFPFSNIIITPKRGAAAFWYNLHASGKQDLRMLRSECPVLTGSKWIANKWIREKYQEFRRPCEIIPDDEYDY